MLRIRRYAVIALTVFGGVVGVATFGLATQNIASSDSYGGQVSPGQAINVTGSGYKALSNINMSLASTPVFLKVVVADQSGNFSTTVTIPADTPFGNHNIVATGVDPNGNPLVEKTLVNVQPVTAVLGNQTTAARGGTLAFTGFNSAGLVTVAVVMVLLGGTLVAGSRSRRRAEAAGDSRD
jgi:hypothetical protein